MLTLLKSCETWQFNLLYKKHFTIYILSTKTIFKRSIGKLLSTFIKKTNTVKESLYKTVITFDEIVITKQTLEKLL